MGNVVWPQCKKERKKCGSSTTAGEGVLENEPKRHQYQVPGIRYWYILP